MKSKKNISVLIRRAADCNLNVFMKCLFEEQYKCLVLSGDADLRECSLAFLEIYQEYLDLTGAGKSQEFGLLKKIDLILTRIKTIENAIYLNRVSIELLKEPFLEALADIRGYGHKIYWDSNNPDPKSFLKRLKDIETREKRYGVELDIKIKELAALTAKQQAKETATDTKKERSGFIKLINALQKYGFQIDRNRTTVEEFALMKQDYEIAAEQAIKESKTRRNGR